MDEYTQAVRTFYEIYKPLQRKYHLRDHMHFSIYENDDGLIEIWEYKGENRGKCILKVRETEDIDCYKKATDELKRYKQEREEREHGSCAAMAG